MTIAALIAVRQEIQLPTLKVCKDDFGQELKFQPPSSVLIHVLNA